MLGSAVAASRAPCLPAGPGSHRHACLAAAAAAAPAAAAARPRPSERAAMLAAAAQRARQCPTSGVGRHRLTDCCGAGWPACVGAPDGPGRQIHVVHACASGEGCRLGTL
eukprot:352630-Chlamydomonas_euryale.AAC.14